MAVGLTRTRSLNESTLFGCTEVGRFFKVIYTPGVVLHLFPEVSFHQHIYNKNMYENKMCNQWDNWRAHGWERKEDRDYKHREAEAMCLLYALQGSLGVFNKGGNKVKVA